MSHQKIIQDLIAWIDELSSRLTLMSSQKKSGYSKWYLQRMFRTVTHQTLGDCDSPAPSVTGRLELRTTERPIFDIAMDQELPWSLSRPSPAFSVGSLIGTPAIIATACSLLPAR